MKKKPISKSSQLSPENYIRQKSRNLPIIDCYINRDWEESRLCNIVIYRQHASGNVTFCIYFVDLNCLGVTESSYQFNMPYESIEEMLNKSTELGIFLMKTTYELVHNIIYAGIEFAEDFGFEPCREYKLTTKYFLAEDTNAIPLVTIACGGKDGKPVYINTGFESTIRQNQILAQLEKTAGAGNYNVILSLDDIEEQGRDDHRAEDQTNEEFGEEDETTYNTEYEIYKRKIEAIENEYKGLSFEEKKQLLKELLKKKNIEPENAKENVVRTDVLTHLIATVLTDADKVKEQLAAFKKKFGISFFDVYTIPNSLFMGVNNLDLSIVDSFRDTMFAIVDNKQPKEAIAQFRKKTGKAPVYDLAELFYCRQFRPFGYVNKALKCYNKYPDYFLFQVFASPLIHYEKPEVIILELENILIQKKNIVTRMEIGSFFDLYTPCFLGNVNTDLSKIMAYDEYIDSLHFKELPFETPIKILINCAKTSKVAELINL